MTAHPQALPGLQRAADDIARGAISNADRQLLDAGFSPAERTKARGLLREQFATEIVPAAMADPGHWLWGSLHGAGH